MLPLFLDKKSKQHQEYNKKDLFVMYVMKDLAHLQH